MNMQPTTTLHLNLSFFQYFAAPEPNQTHQFAERGKQQRYRFAAFRPHHQQRCALFSAFLPPYRSAARANHNGSAAGRFVG